MENLVSQALLSIKALDESSLPPPPPQAVSSDMSKAVKINSFNFMFFLVF